MCREPRPNPHQWALICDRSAVICRDCLHAHHELLASPVQRLGGRVAPLPAELSRVFTVVDGVPRRAEAALCVICRDRHTRRPEGYCAQCTFDLLRDCHGGYGAYRCDGRGRPFQVYRDVMTLQETLPREAFYPWGRELLPRAESSETTQQHFDDRANYMWRLVNDETIVTIDRWAMRRAGARYSPETHDAAVEAACRAALTYEPGRAKALYETYLYRCVARAVSRQLARDARRRRGHVSIEGCELQLGSRVDESEQQRMNLLFGRVHDPAALLQELGLTPFEKKLLTLWVVEGLALDAIGRKYGVVKSTVSHWIFKIRRKAEAARAALRKEE